VGVDAQQHVAEVGQRIEAGQFAGHDHAEQDGGVLRPVIAARKQPACG
jgi:hypothetical protein